MARPAHTPVAGVRARALRRDLTVSEARMWWALKGGATGARFRRQVPLGPWIVDFASFSPQLVIEIDDTSHDFRDETARTRYIEGLGFPILRFTNEEMAKELPEAVRTVEFWVDHLKRTGRPPE